MRRIERRPRLVLLAYLLGLAVLATACAGPAAPLPAVPLPTPTPAAPVDLPRDAGPHDALTEWWYYTGHLADTTGHHYGFEFTIFQVRRQGEPAGYLAHFAVSDVDGQRFSHQARSRQGEAIGSLPLDVGGWTLASAGGADQIDAAMQPGPAVDPVFAVHLRLVDAKPAALHHGGYIEYGPAGGSYYYSRTRLDVTGQLQAADGEPAAVTGQAWMDHQWGNFVVTGTGGWDWYSLQLDDDTELMLYVLRDAAGQTTGVYGTRVLADGTAQELEPGGVQAQATGTWTSPHTGGVYPSGWRLALPDGRSLVVSPRLVDQELYFPGVGGLAYWEGAVSISGAGQGLGYVELTGYAPPAPPSGA